MKRSTNSTDPVPVTLKHIANELGVSQMTVSRALRGVSATTSDTRQKVREAAIRLGYRPISGVMFPPVVRSGKGSHALRLLLPTVCRRIGDEGGAWWLDRMVDAMRDRLELSNGRLVEQHFRGIDELITDIERSRPHGVVLRQPLPDAWAERINALAPVVYAIEFDNQLNVDSVYSNEHRSASMVLKYLRAHGHRRIAWFGIFDKNAPSQVIFDAKGEQGVEEWQAYSQHGVRHASWANVAYCQSGAERDSVILVERDWQTQDLNAAVKLGLERVLALTPKPTAVVCSSDPVATAFVSAMRRRGLDSPRDLSIITYGGSDEAKLFSPSITSLEMPMENIGRVIPELVERRLADPQAVPISVQFQTTLWEGASVAAMR